VRLGGESFTVVGLVEPPEGFSPDVPAELIANLVYIPAGADRTRFGEYDIIRTTGRSEGKHIEISQIIFHMADEQAVLAAAKIAEGLLEREHEDRDYEIQVPLDKIRQLEQQRRLWNIMFFVIASISLLVGGIGIANIMLASVTERTREIGIRRALGAKRRDITVQFLVEAVTQTTVGGITGIVLGYAVPPFVEKVLQIRALLSPPMLAVPFVMAIVVGLVSGIYPAMRAARLDPITALRHE
jgi:putative ABC transport system permease protein